MTKIAILCTSATTFGKNNDKGPTGVWLEEIATPYYAMKEKGFSIDFFSVRGNEIPIDNGSRGEGFYTADCKRFDEDEECKEKMKTSRKLSDLNAEEYDGVFLPGGHGCCTDFHGNEELAKVIETFLSKRKPVALDCHAPIALLSCTKADGKTPLVSGMSVTGFSDEEETQVGMQEEVPTLIEKEMVAQGAKYSKAESAWGAHAVVDGTLVTGQNPASSKLCAEKFVELLALTQTQVN
jgi:putative intracellular protease/amidase